MTCLKSFSLSRLLCALVLSQPLFVLPALAQEANILGLPAIPQPKPGAVANPAPAASGAKTPAGTPTNRDILAGEMGLQHSAISGTGRMIITTRATFGTAGAKSSAIDAARAVQRDLVLSCAKQCKPLKMSNPKILPSGQMEFELAFAPLHQHLNQAQFLAALQSKPFNLTPAQLSPPAPPPPAISVSVETAPSKPPNTATQ
jgi:hypothetical protein